MSANPLHVNATELLREPGQRRHVSVVIAPDDIDAAHPAISGELSAELEVESTLDDIGVSGTIDVPWRGSCRRCLAPIDHTIVIDVDERYATQPTADEATFPIEHGQIDLAPMLREHVLLIVDDPRLCRPDCAGLCPTCGADLNAGPCECPSVVSDDRWAVLDQLRER
jgi:DUF177 domain-containing protein